MTSEEAIRDGPYLLAVGRTIGDGQFSIFTSSVVVALNGSEAKDEGLISYAAFFDTRKSRVARVRDGARVLVDALARMTSGDVADIEADVIWWTISRRL